MAMYRKFLVHSEALPLHPLARAEFHQANPQLKKLAHTHFFLPTAALAAAWSFFFSSPCFFLNSMSSSVCSFFGPEAFFLITSFCDLLEVPTGMAARNSWKDTPR